MSHFVTATRTPPPPFRFRDVIYGLRPQITIEYSYLYGSRPFAIVSCEFESR
jgi:hypothetical protein